jgi:hypothetical protein
MKFKGLAVILALLMIMPLCFQSGNVAKAEELGPIGSIQQGGPPTEILTILSPRNHVDNNGFDVATYYNTNKVLVNFTIRAERGVWDVGYSLDKAPIQRITSLSQISNEPANFSIEVPPYIVVTVLGTFYLTNLTDGIHSLTIYNGNQYTGNNARFDVLAYATVGFAVDTEAPIITSLSFCPTIGTNFNETGTVGIYINSNEFLNKVKYSVDNQANVTGSSHIWLHNLTTGT